MSLKKNYSKKSFNKNFRFEKKDFENDFQQLKNFEDETGHNLNLQTVFGKHPTFSKNSFEKKFKSPKHRFDDQEEILKTPKEHEEENRTLEFGKKK